MVPTTSRREESLQARLQASRFPGLVKRNSMPHFVIGRTILEYQITIDDHFLANRRLVRNTLYSQMSRTS